MVELMATRRILLTLADTRCPFGCQYCFAEFSQYERPLTLEDVEHTPNLLEDADVIYPACDVDLFATRRPLDILRRTAALGRSISVSTKATLSHQLVTKLAEVAQELESRERILKVGISISTKYSCGRIEPRAANYSARIENLRLLRRAAIPNCLVLKPLLFDVPVEEYCEIISDVAGLTECILIGDEYLDISNPRISPGTATQRAVTWVVNKPSWPVSSAPGHAERIQMCAEGLGLRVFESDLAVMAALKDSRTAEMSLSTA